MPADDYRDLFPVTREWSYLNHAAVAPLSLPAQQRFVEWSQDYVQQGAVREAAWYGEIETVRKQSAELINSDSEEIAFLKNTSEGLSLVAEGLDFEPGESIVIISGEFPSNVYPWLQKESQGIEVRKVPQREQGRILLEDIAAAIDETTRLLSISFVQYASGFRSDVAAIGRLCRERNVLFCLDAIQGLGVFPVDVRAMNIDFLAADGHKWLVSPEGAAIFYCRRELLDRLRPTTVGWRSVAAGTDFSKIDLTFPDSATRFECGTMNVAGIAALGASLRMFSEIGIETINQRVRNNTDRLVDRLHEAGADVFSPRDEDGWSGIVSFDLPGGSPRRIKKHCIERNVVVSYRDGRVRASPHFYNNDDDINALIEALQTAPRE